MKEFNIETPWGLADRIEDIADGITRFHTPSHGGIQLSTDRLNALPDKLKQFVPGVDVNRAIAWLEEDCAWCFAALGFPDSFPDDQENAEITLRHYYPEAWEAYFNKKLEPGMSNGRDQENFMSANAENYIVCSAWGSWAEHVPTGMVGVYATKGGRSGPGAYFLIPQPQYDNRANGNFVVDEAIHERLEGVVLGPSKSVDPAKASLNNQ